jgi:hypothetical protein
MIGERIRGFIAYPLASYLAKRAVAAGVEAAQFKREAWDYRELDETYNILLATGARADAASIYLADMIDEVIGPKPSGKLWSSEINDRIYTEFNGLEAQRLANREADRQRQRSAMQGPLP